MRFIIRNWLMQLWKLRSPHNLHKLETQESQWCRFEAWKIGSRWWRVQLGFEGWKQEGWGQEKISAAAYSQADNKSNLSLPFCSLTPRHLSPLFLYPLPNPFFFFACAKLVSFISCSVFTSSDKSASFAAMTLSFSILITVIILQLFYH